LPRDIDTCQYRWASNSLAVTGPPGAAVCCSPLSAGPLSAEQASVVAPLLKALADPVRLRLMSLVASHPGGEACVCDLNDAFDLSQPTISHHLKVLHDAGLLDRDKRGVWVYYRARTGALASLGTLIGCPP
jgi:ArsR family transcriptional regulator